MHALRGRPRVFGILVLLLSSALSAEDVPVANWAVPPYRIHGSGGGMSTMVDVSPAVAFVAMQPCRVVDTRGGGVFTGAYGPPNMAAGATRTFDINSAAHCPGIPAEAEAYSLNFTVTQTAGPLGDIRAWPTGNPPAQLTSVLNWTVTGATLANAAIVPAGANGSIDVQVAGSNTHLLIDINGYFSAQQNLNQRFHLFGEIGGVLMLVENSSALTSWGVSASIQSQADGSAGIRGISFGDPGATFGLDGQNLSSGANSAGVRGFADALPNTASTAFTKSGVRGESKDGNGTIGISEATAVGGFLMNPADGTISAQGRLGFVSGAMNYGVHSIGNAHVQGLFTATAKAFVEPHPSDPSKEIRYVSLEGPHAEVYFRGTAQVSRGVTRIRIPEDFRIVADAATYATLVTPVGSMATVAVLSEGADGIVIQASRDIKVHYVVYAEREAVRNPEPIVENVHFRADPGAEFLGNLPEIYRRRMIENGTLNADGTVNMETAQRLGWDRLWERSAGAPEPRTEAGPR